MAETMIEGQQQQMGTPTRQILHFLTEEELNQIPPDVRTKSARAFAELNKNFQITLAQKHKERVSFEEQINQINTQWDKEKTKVETLNHQLAEEKKAAEEYIDKYRNTLTTNNELEENFRKTQRELFELKTKHESLSFEKDELLSIVNKRNSEVEKYMEDVKSLSDQLQKATVAKIEAIVKVDELQSKEVELDYKEKQIEKEKEWVSKQVQILNDELDRKNTEIMEMQRESRLKYLNIQMEMSEKAEQLRAAELALENAKQSNEEQEKHIESLIQKLRDEQDVESKMEENYRQELKSLRKIADLYKESSDEAYKKVEELEDAVTNLQELLKMATERFADLESRFERAGKSFQDEVTQRDERIENLEKELSHANELITNIKKQGLTDEMIHALSPAAAAAAQMLKNSKSLTEIYSKHQELHSELLASKYENEKLNNYIQQILMEIEEKAPLVKTQMKELNETRETVDALTHQLNLSMSETGVVKDELAFTKKNLGALERENARMTAQVNDMSLQIKMLLREIEAARGNYTYEDEDRPEVPDINELDSSGVISQRLVTFKNIDELLNQNQNLLAVVRELSESQEKDSRELSDKKVNELKEAFESAKQELIELRKSRERYEKSFSEWNKQKDVQSIFKQHSPDVGSRRVAEESAQKNLQLEKKVLELETALKTVKEDYDTYRSEKAANDKISQEQLEKLRDEVMRMRTDNSKLASQAEFHNERAKIWKSNLETHKKNISALEERNKQNSLIIMRHEESIGSLRSELASEQNKLAKAEVALARITQERDQLKDSKGRLEAERDLFVRERKTQQILQINLEEIKNNLEMSYSSVRTRLENQVQSLEEETKILRRKLDQENSEFRESVGSWDSANKELQNKLKSHEEIVQKQSEEIAQLQGVINTQKNELEELNNKLKTLAGSPQRGPGFSQASQAKALSNTSQIQLENKTKELNLKLIDSQTEIKSLNHQLEMVKENLAEHKKLCSSMEEQIAHLRVDSSSFEQELHTRLSSKDATINELRSKLDEVESENFNLKNMRDGAARELEAKVLGMEEEFARMQRDLQNANRQVQAYIEENLAMKHELDASNEKIGEMEKKFESEMAQYVQEARVGGEIKIEMDSLRDRVGKEERLRIKAEERANELMREYEVNQASQISQLEELRRNLSELEALNNSLQEQLINQTTQLISLRRGGGSSSGGEPLDKDPLTHDTSFSSTGDSDPSNSEQWLQLVRYLRREKEIAKTKSEMDQATAERLTNSMATMEKQFEEAKRSLAELQDKSQVSIITSVKQADLLRKVETLSALADSNRILREEKDRGLEEIEGLKVKLSSLEAEMGPLKLRNSEIENRCETLQNENVSIKQDAQRWKQRASALIEKSAKINPEDFKKLQDDKDTLQKHLNNVQELTKRQQQEIVRQTAHIKMMQGQINTLSTNNLNLEQEKKLSLEDHKKTTEERNKLKEELDSIKVELNGSKELASNLEKERAKLKESYDQTVALCAEQKNTLRQIKGLAKKYKGLYEETAVKLDETSEEKKDLETQIIQLTSDAANKESASKETTDSASMTDPVEAPEPSAQTPELSQTAAKQREEIENLKKENEGLKLDNSQRDERTKQVLKTLRERLSTATTAKQEIETELNALKTKLDSTKASNDESNTRFAALKSQYEGRINRLEKENKELREGGVGEVPSNVAALQEENERLKKDLEMVQTRTTLIEKQFKAAQGQSTSKGVPSVSTGPEKATPEPPKANIKPQMTGTSTSSLSIQKQIPLQSHPLTASIRPMSQQRKATVKPQTTTTSAHVVPVSQGQVSTSTPDQGSGMSDSTAHTPSTSGVITSTANTTNANNTTVRQATVQPTPTITVTPTLVASGPTGAGVQGSAFQGSQEQGQGSGTGRETFAGAGAGAHEDPSTSHMDDSEMSDSNEQVSSSEPSAQPKLTVAPIRSQPESVGQGSAGVKVEEPSPSTSSFGSRPTQSGKRGRDSEKTQTSEQPELKRSRLVHSMPVEREAEAMAHQQERSGDQLQSQLEEFEDQEADQGQPDEEPHSDTSELKPTVHQSQMEEDDDDCIVIESSDEDEGGDEEEEDEDDEGVEEEEEDVDEESSEWSGSPSKERRSQAQAQERRKQEFEYDDEEEDDEDAEEETLEEEEEEGDGGGDDEEDEGEAPIEEGDEEGGGEEEGREAESLEEHGGEAEGVPQEGNLDSTLDIVEEVEASDAPTGMGGRQMPGSSESLSARPVPLSRPLRQDRLPDLRRQTQQMSSSFTTHQQMFGDDPLDEGIVPSTPTLFVPRRSDGFAEAVSSPQVPSSARFTFSTPSDTTTATGGMEDTRVDLFQFDDSTGRSVPTTPHQVSPPVELIDPSQLERGNEGTDVQPSSSDTSREIPSITITSASESALLEAGDMEEEVEGHDEEEEEESSQGDNVQGSTPSRLESSVTSSMDEDRMEGNAGGQQSPSTSTFDQQRAPSPTPSSGVAGQPGSEQNLQQQQVSQQQRTQRRPIIWDQPTSSSSAGSPGRGRGRGSGLGRGSALPQGGEPPGLPSLMGFRQLTRGSAAGPQSARRSRPHGPRGQMRGAGPFGKPY